MNKIQKTYLLLIIAMIIGTIPTSCSNDQEIISEMSKNLKIRTRSTNAKTPKVVATVETNKVNPLNVGEYYLCDSTLEKEPFFDIVVLYASDINYINGKVGLYHNPYQNNVLNAADSIIRPLQKKGIKVLLGLRGGYSSVGFSNMNNSQINDFSQLVLKAINTYGLDGVDFDDEFTHYESITSQPKASAALLGNLIKRMRQLLPDKLISVYRYGGYTFSLNQETMDIIDYMRPNGGCMQTPPQGLPLDKWADLSINLKSYYPSNNTIKRCAMYHEAGTVSIICLPYEDVSETLNCFAPTFYGGRIVYRTNVFHPLEWWK
ncbi:glycosyl hydrolase family 18 protein [Bacteroides sp.]|uniref:glycosyl hydrolase family 18 protein n=1 Tax=Bacteroides sp. TaxID=29523 RepID=UPI002A7F9568|nr:glycosyl hydrolase family 18 protein [Bacteroides sp.]